MAALYDAFSADYDRFVNWEERLAYELPSFRCQKQRQPGRNGEKPGRPAQSVNDRGVKTASLPP
jgi:hypothetical protein